MKHISIVSKPIQAGPNPDDLTGPCDHLRNDAEYKKCRKTHKKNEGDQY